MRQSYIPSSRILAELWPHTLSTPLIMTVFGKNWRIRLMVLYTYLNSASFGLTNDAAVTVSPPSLYKAEVQASLVHEFVFQTKQRWQEYATTLPLFHMSLCIALRELYL
eukprot:gb/GECG01003562.1/.p1 GENE.gb/GECG01003562.1/~~gb/GECG01003562.1/.p1  ORF type:complete len:109 (+),score=4.99 gb/GECG01003562.1/:1-327(+)